MNDYHKRFRERLDTELGLLGMETRMYLSALNQEPSEFRSIDAADRQLKARHAKLMEFILAFIDEVAGLERSYGHYIGRERERAALIEKIEGMKDKDGDNSYNAAIRDVLTYLREHDAIQTVLEAKEEPTFKDLGEFAAAPPEKKKQVMLKVAREATNDQRAQIGLPPLQSPTQEETECCDKCFAWKPRSGETFCINQFCPCHKPQMDYSKRDHTHCWNQDYSYGTACGLEKEKHTQCCLCGEPRTEGSNP